MIHAKLRNQRVWLACVVNVCGGQFYATPKTPYLYSQSDNIGVVAEEVGFEPTEGVNPRRFSRPVHSTTLPLLRRGFLSLRLWQ